MTQSFLAQVGGGEKIELKLFAPRLDPGIGASVDCDFGSNARVVDERVDAIAGDFFDLTPKRESACRL
jgi:hypothetical protein